MDNAREKREAIGVFLGMAVIMYIAAAYEATYGFSRSQSGAFAQMANSLRAVFGENVLVALFAILGAFFLWRAASIFLK